MKYTIRPYQPGDEEGINRGFNAVFGTTRSIAEWHWKYAIEKCESWITVAVDEESRILAHYSAIKQNLKVRDKIFVVGQGVDLYRSGGRSYQNSLVFSRTANKFYDRIANEEQVPFVFGFPGEIARKAGRWSAGSAVQLKVSLWKKPVRKKWFYSRHSDATTIPPPAKEIDCLWEIAHNRYPITIVRNGHRFYRRYVTHPQRTYHYIPIRRYGALHALAVLWNSADALRLVDLLWNGADPETLRSLESSAVRLAQKIKARRILMWLRGDSAASEIFRTAGWTERDEAGQPYFAANSWTSELNADDFVQNCYIMMGDSDLV